MIFPEAMNKIGEQCGVSGGWMFDLADGLSNKRDLELAIASTYDGRVFRKEIINNKTYYMLPGGGKSLLTYDKKLIPFWKFINEDFHPDLVHLHGTEYKHGLVFMDIFPDKNYLLTIQGIMRSITREYYGGLKVIDIIKCLTFKELIHGKSLFTSRYLAHTRELSERRIVQRVQYITGRTDWDQAVLYDMNPNAKYFRCNYNLRKEFYEAPKWEIKKIEPHTIYGSTSLQTPYKGGVILVKAISLVKRVYPNVRIKALLPGSKNGEFHISNGFTQYIKSLISKYDLWDNFEFLPSLSAESVIKTMLSCNCVVVPSAMENASSTLREAMHLGVPSIAAFRGGMTHLIDDRVNGFFFDYPEYSVLANRIISLFESEELCNSISINAIKKATMWHDREKNTQSMYNVYQFIAKENNL